MFSMALSSYFKFCGTTQPNFSRTMFAAHIARLLRPQNGRPRRRCAAQKGHECASFHKSPRARCAQHAQKHTPICGEATADEQDDVEYPLRVNFDRIGLSDHVWFTPNSDRTADIPDRQLRAINGIAAALSTVASLASNESSQKDRQ
jgi:hypothetical protein